MACCGTDCSLTVDSKSAGIYQFNISIGGNLVDVSTFTSGSEGDWISCSENVTLSCDSYIVLSGISKGETGLSWEAVVCGTTITSAEGLTCTSITIGPIDATSVATVNYGFKVNGDISIT